MRAYPLLTVSAALLTSSVFAQTEFQKFEIETTDLGNGVYMLVGAGGNIGISAGEDGVIMIDDQYAPLSDKIMTAISSITEKPVSFVVNTHFHGDHTGGNENFGQKGAVIVAHDNVRERMSVSTFSKVFNRERPAAPTGALPIVTFADEVTFHINGDTISITHIDPAHTDGDSVVHFESANVIHCGDIYFAGRYPFVDLESGGTLDGMIDGMSKVIELANDDTQIIPGHGPLSNKAQSIAYRDMLVEVRTRVAALIDEGKSLEQVLAAKPLSDLDATWSSDFINGERMTATAFYAITATLPQ